MVKIKDLSNKDKTEDKIITWVDWKLWKRRLRRLRRKEKRR